MPVHRAGARLHSRIRCVCAPCGDEFCLVLPNCSAATAQTKMLSLQQAFAALPVASNAPYERMFSFGVAAAEKNHGIVTIDSLLQQADAAMYAQKRRHQTGGKA